MLQNLSDFVDPEKDRDATLFLPAAVFGYIYSENSAVRPCPWVADNIGALGMPEPVFLVLAVFSAVAAAVLYNLQEKTIEAAESREGVAMVAGWTVQSVFVLLSVSELVIRVCSQDVVIVGVLLLYVVLGVSTMVELTAQKS